MAAFLRNLIMILTAVTLLEHLLPQGPMHKAGRMVLGLVLIYTVLSGLGGLADGRWAQEVASPFTGGPAYQAQAYAQIVREAWREDWDGD